MPAIFSRMAQAKNNQAFERARREINNVAAENSHTLNLSGFGLTALPPEIGSLTALQHLYIDNNQLSVLPPEIGSLTALQHLYIDNNQLSVLTPEIGSLTALQTLHLYRNQLHTLPPKIGLLRALKTLDVSRNQLITLPSQISLLTELQWLFLEGNELTSLPPEMTSLAALRTLNLEGNSISNAGVLADLLQGLPELERIDVWRNPLLTRRNTKIDLSGFGHYSSPSALLTYLRRVLGGPTICLREARVVFIGTGENGKTQLAGALSGRRKAGERVTTRTKGVDVETVKSIRTNAHGEVTCRIFDCGGQPEQYQIHRAFWEALRNVMVLVVDASKPIGWQGKHAVTGKPVLGNRVDYFLRMIEAEFAEKKAKPPSMLIVMTHGDLLPKINAKFTDAVERAAYPTIESLKRFCTKYQGSLDIRVVDTPVDALNQIGLDAVRTGLKELLENTEGLSAELPENFGDMRKYLQSQFGTFEEPEEEVSGMSVTRFREFCAECGEEDDEQQMVYLRTLASLGDVIHAEMDLELRDNVLNIHWGRKALYELLTHEKVKVNRGELSDEELAEVLPKHNRELARTLAESLQLMFRVQGEPDKRTGRTRDRWLVPQILPFKDNPHVWTHGKPFVRIEAGRFLSEIWFLRQLGTHANAIADRQTEAFRDEVMFSDPPTGARALVRPDYESADHAIGIWADPNDATGLSKAWCREVGSWLKGWVELSDGTGASESGEIVSALANGIAPEMASSKPGQKMQPQVKLESLACAYLYENPTASKAEIAQKIGFPSSLLSTRGRWKEFKKLWDATQKRLGKNLPEGVKHPDGSIDAHSNDK